VVSWLSHALTTAPWHAGEANIYYPDPRALYYGPAGFGAVPYALPAFVVTGNAAVAANVAFLSSVALTALALHWVVWRWTRSAAAGFVAAWTLLVNRWFLWGFVATTPHLAAIQYLPLIAFLAAEPLWTRRRALVLLALITLQCLTDPVYVAPAVMIPLGVLALSRLGRRAWRSSGWRLFGVLAAVPLCLAPFMIGYVRVRMDNPALARQSLYLHGAAGVLSPTDLTTLFWSSPTPQLPPPTSIGFAVLGLIALGGLSGALGRLRGAGSGLGRPWAHAALWALVGTVISLNAVAEVNFPWIDGTWTRIRIYLPQYLLAVHTQLYDVVRVPSRLGVGAMIGICLLAGLALAELVEVLPPLRGRGRAASGARAVLAVAIAVFVYRLPPVGSPALPSAYRLQNAPPTDPELLRQLRAADGPLLEIPATYPGLTGPNARSNAVAMFRSTRHWRPLVNGYSSYWPAGFLTRLRASDRLPAPLALRRLVCDTGVRTILVNLVYFLPNRAEWLRARTVPMPGLQFIAEYPGQLLFAVTVPPPGAPGGPSCLRPAGDGASVMDGHDATGA
jgi:hypothetical protein